MRRVGIGILSALLAVGAAQAQDDEAKIASKVQEEYKNAKTKDEVEGITLYCKDKIKSLTFKERNFAMVLAIKYLETNRVAEARGLLKRVRELEEHSDNRGAVICKPAKIDG